VSEPQEDQVLYFAYGTLLGTAAMAGYCPSATPVGQATLTGYEFSFERYGSGPNQGGCSLVRAEGAQTRGVLYRMAADDWQVLREVSGEHTDYEVLPVTVQRDDRTPIAAHTLTVKRPIGPFRPSEEYLSLVVDGAASAGLPGDYRAKLNELIERTRALQPGS
jgi:cation transport regulator ChaC